MSLDKFQMSSELVYELYKNSLVALDSAQRKPESLNSEKPAFLGNHTKNLLILVRCANALHLDEQSLQLLIGILSACKLTMDDVAVFNIHQHEVVNDEYLIQHFQPQKIICFGIEAKADLSIPKNIFEPTERNNIQWISSPPLEQINGDVQMKKSLWNGLKIFFGL
jgi:DNA polymerase III psi subunit